MKRYIKYIYLTWRRGRNDSRIRIGKITRNQTEGVRSVSYTHLNNTPDADWYLKDFSDNGRDMQLYNYGKTPESGINEEGGLQSDGITDYGKAENLPIYKDYTVVADREIVDGLINNADGGVATRGTKWDTGAFCFDYTDGVYSFGATNGYVDRVKPNRFISYMSKYIHNGITTPVGDAVDNNPCLLYTS